MQIKMFTNLFLGFGLGSGRMLQGDSVTPLCPLHDLCLRHFACHPHTLGFCQVQGSRACSLYTSYVLQGTKEIIWKMCLNADSGTLHARAVSSTGCAPPTSEAASLLDTVTNHCNRNRPKGGLWCSNVERVVTGAYNRGEIGLLRPYGSWRTSLYCLCPPPPPVKKQIANDHTPTSLEAGEKGIVEEVSSVLTGCNLA